MLDEMSLLEDKIRVLVQEAWEREVHWADIEMWLSNFKGSFESGDEEKRYVLFLLSRYMYFNKRLIREMLRSIYRDHFESPMLQRIRRNLNGTKDFLLVRQQYHSELRATRFVGIGNPAESGAHLLYYFRQVNNLQKDLFADFTSAFEPCRDNNQQGYRQKDPTVTRFVFFDDLVGSGTQVAEYLEPYLNLIRKGSPNVEMRFISLFGTTTGLTKLASPALFGSHVSCLFELDNSYKAFSSDSRYFRSAPAWFKLEQLKKIAVGYGKELNRKWPTGYRHGQLLLAFSHNTPDNAPPIFWYNGENIPWHPVFVRYEKFYD
ncbi:hypothetical protein SAMN05216403_106104 [Nitrosospira multiformis ATCC 25196]|uniref:PRTase-CE domain-containing protein n=1 Tax=Nitrosospira multiformis (strain ATCC 25196 / NCIMB 11849 / C 71) TaxID=323848 RepID=Q2Y6V4_NITMU|nr:hypothetical protein [Nitrosospira multiformis]ABB75517.1 hypothetical protein Nmul_A2225 [Nitrosospira multiformis ATCC 25196]SEF70664.1 hypothetical protein SAMN05216403_106104 [Nitrosospira multiformis ATCC 25196]